jgi:4-hydroxy-tetrahydrodipicolinate synthase
MGVTLLLTTLIEDSTVDHDAIERMIGRDSQVCKFRTTIESAMNNLHNEFNGVSRRSFLRLSSAMATVAVTPRFVFAKPAEPKLRRPLDPQEFKKHLAGPILSLPTTFNEDLSVNHNAIRTMIDRAVRYSMPIYQLTAGDSMYSCLTFDEIKSVTQSMIEAVGGRGLTIAATGAWPAEQVIDYAGFAKSHGADAVQVMLPESMKDENLLYEHFLRISNSTALPIVLHGEYSRSLLTRLARIDSIVAMKEDSELTYYIDRIIGFGDRFEIYSGGAETRFLVGYPYGARAFFSTYSSFAPDKPMLFWEAIRSDNLKQAVAITKKYDHPFISRFTHPFWRATLEYFGVAKRFMRKPFETMPENQLADVKAFFDGQGISPADYAG